MSDCMHFPDTVEEFMEQYKMTDTEQVYSNGTEYVPIFRMKQWFEHEKAQLSQQGTTSDMISREAVIDLLKQMRKDGDMVPWEGKNVFARIRKLPSAQPEPQEGEWVPVTHGRGGYECNRCHEYAPTYHKEFLPNYCPNCGAKMTISTK